MATKDNIRSMRFSDEMYNLIDQQTGDTFTQKFELLVRRCNWELPSKEKELAEIQAKIDSKRNELSNLSFVTRELQSFMYLLENAKRSFERVEQSAANIAKNCNTQ